MTMKQRLKSLLRAAGIEFSGEPDVVGVLFSSNPRSEIFLPFLIDHPARLDEIVSLAANPASRRKAQRTLQALFFLLEWGPLDAIYGPRLTEMAKQIEINCGGKERIKQYAERLGLKTEKPFLMLPYPRRYLKLAAALGQPEPAFRCDGDPGDIFQQ